MTHVDNIFTYKNNAQHLTLTKVNNILEMETIIIISNLERKYMYTIIISN